MATREEKKSQGHENPDDSFSFILEQSQQIQRVTKTINCMYVRILDFCFSFFQMSSFYKLPVYQNR